ncbi:MAG TPA: hypothetical protein DCM87_16455 [Planctomycetes bacterium]|nr:hypothetical protein [Planctomycetota bacterium]
MLALALYAQAQAPADGGQAGWDKVTGPQGAWVYIVVGAYDTVGPRLESAAAKLGPEASAAVKGIPAHIREGVGDNQGIDRDAVDLSRPFAIAVYNPLAGQPPAAIVPVKGDLAGDKRVINGYIVACDNEMLAARLTSSLESAGAGAIAGPAGAVRIYVDVGTIFQLFGPFVQMQLAAGMGGAGGPSGAERQMAMAGVDLIFNLMGQLKHVLVDLDVNDRSLLVTKDVVAKEGTDLAQLFGSQGGGTALAGMLPARSFVLSAKLKGIGPFALKLADRWLGKALANPADAKYVRDAFAKFVNGAGDEFAMGGDFSPDGYAGDQVVSFTGTMDDAREYHRAFTSDKTPAAIRALMRGGTYTLQENIRQSGGVAVDKFTSTVDTSALGAEAGAQLQKLFGGDGMQGEFALANGKLIVCTGGKDCSQRLDALVAASKNSAGAPGAQPVAFNFDILRLAGGIARAMGAGAEAPAAAAAPVSGTVTFSGAAARSGVVIPIDAIAKVKEFAEQIMGGGMGMGEPVAPVPVPVEEEEE